MKSVWFKKCKSASEKKSVEQTLRSHKATLDSLQDILGSMLKENPASTDYDSASWAYKQADRNGYNRAINQLLEIVNLDKE